MNDMMKRGLWRGRPPFESMARAELMEWYDIVSRLAKRTLQMIKAGALEISIPDFDAEGGVPDHHLVLVLDELWLLADSFRLRDPRALDQHPCCDATNRLLSTPARCETAEYCPGCAYP